MFQVKRAGAIVILILATTFVVTAFQLSACIPEQNAQPAHEAEGETTMTKDELIETNTAIVLGHLKEIGYNGEGIERDEFAYVAAGWLSDVSDGQVITIDSVVHENGGIDITITDENEDVFIMYFSARASLSEIRDAEGNLVLGLVM